MVALAPQVTVQSLGPNEGGVVLRLDTGDMYTVNDTAFDFLQRVDGARSILEIAAELATFIDVEPAILVDDLCEVAEGLRQETLLVEK